MSLPPDVWVHILSFDISNYNSISLLSKNIRAKVLSSYDITGRKYSYQYAIYPFDHRLNRGGYERNIWPIDRRYCNRRRRAIFMCMFLWVIAIGLLVMMVTLMVLEPPGEDG